MNLREHLEDIYVSRGELTPTVVVEEATPVEHPLHHRFEWDNDRAADQYRLAQAAELIREVRITYGDDHGLHGVRAFVSVQRGDARRTYMPLEQVKADPLQRAMLLRQMEYDWRAFKGRYEDMEEFLALDFPATG